MYSTMVCSSMASHVCIQGYEQLFILHSCCPQHAYYTKMYKHPFQKKKLTVFKTLVQSWPTLCNCCHHIIKKIPVDTDLLILQPALNKLKQTVFRFNFLCQLEFMAKLIVMRVFSLLFGSTQKLRSQILWINLWYCKVIYW